MGEVSFVNLTQLLVCFSGWKFNLYIMLGVALLLMGMPHMDMSRLWVSTSGNTRVQIDQRVSSNNNKCTINVSENSYTVTGQKEMMVQIFTQQKEMWVQMADTWDKHGKNTTQLRNDLRILDQKIAKLSSETREKEIRQEVLDIQQFNRTTIHQDIRSIMLQRI